MDPSTKFALFIPTYNVGTQLPKVLQQLTSKRLDSFAKIYFVDNGSRDQTVETLKTWSQSQDIPIELYQNKENVYLGGSTSLAFDRALADGMDYLICMHSDGQASAEDLDQFVEAGREKIYDFILGSRFVKGSKTNQYSRTRYLFNYLFCLLQQTLIKEEVYDIGAFIGFRMETIKKIPYKSIPFDMGYHPYLILLASQKIRNIKFKEFPIQWGQVETTNVNVLLYGMVHLSRILKLHFKFKVDNRKEQSFETVQII